MLFLALVSVLSVAHAGDEAPDCSRPAGSLVRPHQPAGTPDMLNPIEHVFVIMNENHSFDNVFGKLSDPKYFGDAIDGLKPGLFNLDSKGDIEEPFHLAKYCVKDMDHSWGGSHQAWNEGLNDGFVKLNDGGKNPTGFRAMGYYDERDYPLMYFLADRYATADRMFSSVMGPTHPNRFYLYAATSFGRVNNKLPNFFKGGWKQKTIFEQLNDAHVDWAYYQVDYSNVMLFTRFWLKNQSRIKHISKLKRDLELGRVPPVVFIENSTLLGDEHPPFDFQTNQKELAKELALIMKSPVWESSATFITYDEGGGNYDHVSPPRACEPDGLLPTEGGGRFDRYGFRVPFVAVSPWAKRHYVSHETYDHTSILKFIEHKFNVPALTARDANADAMLDLFDFAHPDFGSPALPEVKVELSKLMGCVFRKDYRE